MTSSSENDKQSTTTISSTAATTTTDKPKRAVVAAAVSVSVRCSVKGSDVNNNINNNLNNNNNTSQQQQEQETVPYYLLVQRGHEPNKGMWSLPGGKLEFGESTLAGGYRELQEETIWDNPPQSWDELKWYPHVITANDSIGPNYHYVIALLFAESVPLSSSSPSLSYRSVQDLPIVHAADDAADAKWIPLQEIRHMETKQGIVTPGVTMSLDRIEELLQYGLLPTAKLESSPQLRVD